MAPTPLLRFESPNGMAIANITGRYVKPKPPTVFMKLKTAWTTSFPSAGKLSMIYGEVIALPMPTSKPMAESVETGNMKVLPSS